MQELALLDLPNELLLGIFSVLPTLPLLCLRPVNHRFDSLITRIVLDRLLLAASLPDRKLILECYHPSAQFTEPYVFCDYLGTPGLSKDVYGRSPIYKHVDDMVGHGVLQRLYSIFRPTRKSPGTRVTRSHPAGDVVGSRTSDLGVSSQSADIAEPVKRIISLDSDVNFSQLLVDTSIVQLGARSGIFLSLKNILEKKTIRIFRQWLARKAREPERASSKFDKEYCDDLEVCERENVDTSELLWVDEDNKIAGIKMKVQDKKFRREMPILIHRDEEDEAKSYLLELNELHISAIHLLLAVEEHHLETANDSGKGKAMIFGAFPIPRAQGSQNVVAG